MLFLMVYWNNLLNIARFSEVKNQKSVYLGKMGVYACVGSLRAEGGVRFMVWLRCFCLCQWDCWPYRLRGLEGGRWQYTHAVCSTLCYIWGKKSFIYTVYGYIVIFHLLSWLWCFSLCAARFYFEFQSNGTMMGIHIHLLKLATLILIIYVAFI